jgi:hypothetical protein
MIDAIEHCGLSIHMTGEGLCLTDYDSLVSYLEELPRKTPKDAYNFLNQVQEYLEKLPDIIIGDVVFAS